MFDKNLVDAIIGGKDLDRGSAELSVNLGLTKLELTDLVLTNFVLTRGHGSLLLHPSSFLLPLSAPYVTPEFLAWEHSFPVLSRLALSPL
jgi:hypothetical protein